MAGRGETTSFCDLLILRVPSNGGSGGSATCRKGGKRQGGEGGEEHDGEKRGGKEEGSRAVRAGVCSHWGSEKEGWGKGR